MVLVGVQADCTAESAPSGLGDRLLNHYFRLEKAERRLSALRRERAPRRTPTLQQIELERRRLGRELHTGVGQLLAAIRMQLEIIAAQMPYPVEAVQKALDRIGSLSGDALDEVRGISHRLYPPEWQRLALHEALQRLWESTGIPQNFEARLELDALPREPHHGAKVLLYRAAQEALSNIARHSRASCVAMKLTTRGGCVLLTVHDNGRGFDGEHAGEGLGLRSIRDAAAELMADFRVETAPGSTTLSVSAPMEFSEEPGCPTRLKSNASR
jgi:two-component system NarL family sensor kinase